MSQLIYTMIAINKHYLSPLPSSCLDSLCGGLPKPPPLGGAELNLRSEPPLLPPRPPRIAADEPVKYI